MKLYVENINKTDLPRYGNPGDAGMDVRAAEDCVIRFGETKLVPTGIKVAIPAGYELQVRPRSGVSLKTKLRVANTPGTIDAGYTGEICVIMTNTSVDYFWNKTNMCSREYMLRPDEVTYDISGHSKAYNEIISEGKDDAYARSCLRYEDGNGIYHIKKGDRIAQIVLKKYEHIEWEECENINDHSESRGGGFGSTGLT